MDDTPAYATTRRYARIRAVDYVERYVDVPRMLGYCEQCPIYGKAWSCPPFDFDPLKVWASFEWFEIDAVQIEFADEELGFDLVRIAQGEANTEYLLRRRAAGARSG